MRMGKEGHRQGGNSLVGNGGPAKVGMKATGGKMKRHQPNLLRNHSVHLKNWLKHSLNWKSK